MENETAVAVDDATVGLMLLVLLIVLFPLLYFLQHIISHILQREVCTEQSHRSSLTVVDGYGVCGQQPRRYIGRQQRILEVGIHPVGTIALHPLYIPVFVEVIVIYAVNAHHADRSFHVAGGKGNEEAAFLRIIVGNEQQSATDDALVQPDDTLEMVGQFVWIINVALYLMYVIDVCHIDFRQSALYLPMRPRHHDLKTLFSFVVHILPNGEIHHPGNDGHHCQYHNHDA